MAERRKRKPWYKSKTFHVNLAAAVAAVVIDVITSPWHGSTASVVALAVANIVLRLSTSGPVGK